MPLHLKLQPHDYNLLNAQGNRPCCAELAANANVAGVNVMALIRASGPFAIRKEKIGQFLGSI
jgi:hypothetical protein